MKRILAASLIALLVPTAHMNAACGCGGAKKAKQKSEPIQVKEEKKGWKKTGNQPLDTKKYFYDLHEVQEDVVQQVPMPKEGKVLAFEYKPTTGVYANKEMHIAVIGGKEDGKGNRLFRVYRRMHDEKDWTFVREIYFPKAVDSVKAKVGRDGFMSMDDMKVAAHMMIKYAKKDALKGYDIPCCGNCAEGKPCAGESKK